MNPALKRRVDQIRRWWWLVVAATVLGSLAAMLPTLTAPPTYAGKSALVMSSPGRAPEQDTMMVVAYSTMFNEPVTIGRLEDMANIPANVTFEARTVAASPILTIEATADDPQVAQDAAQKMAETFRDDINSVRQNGNEQSEKDLEAQLAKLRDDPTPDGLVNPALAALQDRINSIRFDSTNQLQDLQLRAGVTQIKPNIETNLLLGAMAGLMLGLLGAVGLSSLSTRLDNSDDLRDKAGVEPLVEVPGAGSKKSERLRRDRLRTLANIVELQNLPKPEVVALTGSGTVHATRRLAEGLATVSAQQGNRTVLVYADNQALPSYDGPGFNEVLAQTSAVGHVLLVGEVDSLTIVPPGSVVVDRYSSMTRNRISAVLDELRATADTVIVAGPLAADTAEMQLVCGAADVAVLVVTRKSSRAEDVTSAREALERAHAELLGAVLIDDEKAPIRADRVTHHRVNQAVMKTEAVQSPEFPIELEPSVAGRNGWGAH